MTPLRGWFGLCVDGEDAVFVFSDDAFVRLDMDDDTGFLDFDGVEEVAGGFQRVRLVFEDAVEFAVFARDIFEAEAFDMEVSVSESCSKLGSSRRTFGSVETLK